MLVLILNHSDFYYFEGRHACVQSTEFYRIHPYAKKRKKSMSNTCAMSRRVCVAVCFGRTSVFVACVRYADCHAAAAPIHRCDRCRRRQDDLLLQEAPHWSLYLPALQNLSGRLKEWLPFPLQCESFKSKTSLFLFNECILFCTGFLSSAPGR